MAIKLSTIPTDLRKPICSPRIKIPTKVTIISLVRSHKIFITVIDSKFNASKKIKGCMAYIRAALGINEKLSAFVDIFLSKLNANASIIAISAANPSGIK